MSELIQETIDVVKELLPNVNPFVPNLADYKNPSEGWTEAEYRHFDAPTMQAAVGYWTGEPGEVVFDSWPCAEVCPILEDQYGKRKVFDASQAFIVPKGFQGKWQTLQPSRKIFVAIS